MKYGEKDGPSIRPWEYYSFYSLWPINRTSLFNYELNDIQDEKASWQIKRRTLGDYPYTYGLWSITRKDKAGLL